MESVFQSYQLVRGDVKSSSLKLLVDTRSDLFVFLIVHWLVSRTTSTLD